LASEVVFIVVLKKEFKMLSVAKNLIKKGHYSIHKHEREKKQFPEKIKVTKPPVSVCLKYE
jgi:hypothetical protein